MIGSRSRLFPAWTTYLGVATPLASLVGAVGVGSAANTFLLGGYLGLLGGYLGFLGWCIWTVGVRASMCRH